MWSIGPASPFQRKHDSCIFVSCQQSSTGPIMKNDIGWAMVVIVIAIISWVFTVFYNS
jgi:hypothetical protein